MKHVKLVLLLALVLTAACQPSAAPTKLEVEDTPLPPTETPDPRLKLGFNAPIGESFRMRMMTEQNISQTIQDTQMDVTQTIQFDYIFTLGDYTPEGNIVMSATYDAVFFEMDGPTGVIQYDSTNPPDPIPPEAIGFSVISGKSFTIEVSPEGAVQSVQGIDAMFDEMIAEMKEAFDLSDDTDFDSIMESLGTQFGDEAIKDLMGDVIPDYPDDFIDIGDSWTERKVVSAGFPVVVDGTWTLVARENGVATIDVVSTLSPNPDGKPLELGPMTMRYNLSGSQRGSIQVDETTGWVIRSELVQEISGEVTLVIGEEEESWPISVEGTFINELIED